MSIHIKHSAKNPKHLIIFVHGLGGSAESFQNDKKIYMHDYFNNSILEISDIGYYSYHTKLMSSKIKSFISNILNSFDKEFNNEIHEISEVLKTDCINYMDKYESINFICHSMGGLIVKDLLINKQLKFKNKIFYITLATPHSGSEIANNLIVIKDNHAQIKALKTDSSVLAQLNTEFKHQKNKFNRKYYYSIYDTIVPKKNSFSKGDGSLVTCVNGNHVSICKLNNDKESETLLININKTMMDFLSIKTETETTNQTSENQTSISRGLFDSFNNSNISSYYIRPIDDTIKNILSVKNIWLHGVSGIGKTSIAQYYFLTKKNSFHHSTYFTNTSQDINEYLQLIYEELMDKLEDNELIINNDNNINTKLSKVLCHLSNQYEMVIIHLDELSDLKEEKFKDFFIAFIDILTNQRGDCYMNNVKFIITTLFSPIDYITNLSSESYIEKFHSLFDFRELNKWQDEELYKLYNLLSKQLAIQIENIDEVIHLLNGKPRALKNKFKNLISSGVNDD